MATLAMIKWFVEGTDLAVAEQRDLKNILAGDASTVGTTVRAAWEDLSFSLENDPEFQDIMSSGFSSARKIIGIATNDTETYLKGTSVTVEGVWGGEDHLQVGNVGSGEDATMWGLMIDPNGKYFESTKWEKQGGFCCANKCSGHIPDWFSSDKFDKTVVILGQHTNKYGITDDEWGTTNWCGSLDDWAPYMHLNFADRSALESDIFV